MSVQSGTSQTSIPPRLVLAEGGSTRLPPGTSRRRVRREATSGCRLTRCLLLVFAMGMFAAFSLAELPVARALEPVKIHSGLISGEMLDATVGLQAFRGIPYAAPPVGALRWRPPRDVASWTGTRECIRFGAVCPQPARLTGLVGDPLPTQSEDCLFLNVWTTQAGSGKKLPVMVWIHGGGFSLGWSDQTAYEGSEFAKRGVVLVTINYRVGPLGFFAHPALSAESARDVSGNYGLLDQIAALQWVRKNIAAFGGDAGNVTIFGESAGATSVDALCVSPLAKGLFHRAIAQSPGITDGTYTYLRRPTRGGSSAEGMGEKWATRFLGAEPDDVLATLRGVSPQELIAKSSGLRPVVTIDGWFMTDFSESLFARGKQHDVPLMVGTNSDEGTIFLGSYPYRTVAAFRKGMETRFGASAKDILTLYPVSSDEDIPGAINALITDTWFLRGGTQMLRGMAGVSSPAYQYVFTRKNSSYPERGAYHSAEMYYVFNTLHPSATESDDPRLAAAMIRYWVQFARTGDPNVKGLPEWPEYETDAARYLELGEEIKPGSAYRHAALKVLNDMR